ncbi:B12-binding domain-containing radical SAM protein, partial [Candidatus Omnitrophota bacterium]
IIPSPYLLGFMEVEAYGKLCIETYRGCIGKCTYCNWHKNFQGIRYFSAERIKNEIKLAREKKVNCVIIDTIFNLPHNLSRLGESIIEINKDKSVKLLVEGRAEYVNQETLDLLVKCNVTHMQIGLQSINPTALNNVNRCFDRNLFVQGINFLKKAKISFRLDVIIGLPGDTEQTIKKTLEFVKKNIDIKEIYWETLHVQPDTELRKQAKKFNLKFYKRKPYYIRSTDSLSNQGLKRMVSLLSSERNEALSVQRQDSSKTLENLTPSASFLFFPQEDYEEISKNDFLSEGNMSSFFVIEIDNSKQTVKEIKDLANELKQFVALKPVIFFRCIQTDHEYPLIREFLNQISTTNPFSKLNIFIEDRRSLSGKTLVKLQQSINYIQNYNDLREMFYRKLMNPKTIFDKCNIWSIQPFPRSNSHDGKNGRKVKLLIPKISIEEGMQWEDSLQELLKISNESILIDLKKYTENPSFAIKVLKYIIQNKLDDTLVFFTDYMLQTFYDEILIKNALLLDIVKKFGSIKAIIPNKIIYGDIDLSIHFKKYNFQNALLKLIDFKKNQERLNND